MRNAFVYVLKFFLYGNKYLSLFLLITGERIYIYRVVGSTWENSDMLNLRLNLGKYVVE